MNIYLNYIYKKMKDRESLIGRILEGLNDMLYIWSYEMRQVVKDEGVLIFFILVPLLYPLLYSWAYNNEIVQDTPVVAIDQSHSSLSRDFLRRCDSTQGVHIVSYAADLEEGKEVMRKQGARGIIYIPAEFSDKLNRMEQATEALLRRVYGCNIMGISAPSIFWPTSVRGLASSKLNRYSRASESMPTGYMTLKWSDLRIFQRMLPGSAPRV